MSRPPGRLTVRLAELRPVVEAVELTKGLRGGIVGGKDRSARLVPAAGGMTVELFGSSTFVPIATGALDHDLSVDANLLAGFLRSSTRAFHPAEIVGLNIGPDHLMGTCGTLKVTLQFGARPHSDPQLSRSPRGRRAIDLRPTKTKSETGPAEDVEPMPERPAGPAPDDEGNRNYNSVKGPTETVLGLREAQARPEARETNRRLVDPREKPAREDPIVNAPSRWRRNLVIGVSVLMFFVALDHPRAQRAYYQDAEAFLGMVIFLPILAGLFVLVGIIGFDFIRSPTEQRAAWQKFSHDPVQSSKEVVRFAAAAVFLGCIFLSFFGLEWLLATWVFWTAAGVALVLMFVG